MGIGDKRSATALVRDTRGAQLVEYLVLVGLVALGAAAGLRAMGVEAKRKAEAHARCVATFECDDAAPGASGEPSQIDTTPEVAETLAQRMTAAAERAATEAIEADSDDGGEETPPTERRGPRSLSENRDRLMASLADKKGWSVCEQWAAMNESERYVFMTQTKVLGSYASFIYPPTRHRTSMSGEECDTGCRIDGAYNCPWGFTIFSDEWVGADTCEQCGACSTSTTQDNTETLLDHATTLHSVNGGDPGGGCGGGEYNRMYVGFDDVGEGAIRNHTHSGGTWAKSDDCAGPHKPFTASETISWGRGAAPPWCGAFFWGGQKYGPQRHHWKWDHEAKPLNRLGLCNVTDASVTELDIDYNWKHDSSPTCSYDGRKGYQEVERRMGPAEYDYVPSGCDKTPPNPGWGGGLGCNR